MHNIWPYWSVQSCFDGIFLIMVDGWFLAGVFSFCWCGTILNLNRRDTIQFNLSLPFLKTKIKLCKIVCLSKSVLCHVFSKTWMLPVCLIMVGL